MASTDPADATALEAARFRQVLGHFPTGVAVITASAGSGPVGLAVGSFTSVSLRPALVAFCAAHSSTSWPHVREAGRFCVNVLAEDQEDVCRTFAVTAISGTDKFVGLGWEPSPSGPPRLHGALAWIDCDIEAVHEAGDHQICVGRVLDLDVGDGNGPLVFYRGGYGRFTV